MLVPPNQMTHATPLALKYEYAQCSGKRSCLVSRLSNGLCILVKHTSTRTDTGQGRNQPWARGARPPLIKSCLPWLAWGLYMETFKIQYSIEKLEFSQLKRISPH